MDFAEIIEDLWESRAVIMTVFALAAILYGLLISPAYLRRIRHLAAERDELVEKVFALEGRVTEEHEAYMSALFGEKRASKRIPIEEVSENGGVTIKWS